MIEISYPLVFLLLPVPLIYALLAPAFRQRRDSVPVPYFRRLVDLSGEVPAQGAFILQRVLFQKFWLTASWILLVLAVAKPVSVGEPIVREMSARDLMIAVDLSGSMSARDFMLANGERIERLAAVKRVLEEFVVRRRHDRLGLIVFGDSPYLQAPLTRDLDTWLTLLQETDVGLAGDSTVLGDAIGLAIRLFEDSQKESRVLILLTDGMDTGSRVPPTEAALVAREKGIRIYTVGIGDPQATAQEGVDLEVLEKVAAVTGGEFFLAQDSAELQAVYQTIGALEPEKYETLSFRPRTSLHHYPVVIITLGYALFFLCVAVLRLIDLRERQHV